MSWDDNVYYNPEASGLEILGSLDFSSGSYEFDYTVVWRDAEGQLYYADDSGCSCPSPFENSTKETLSTGNLDTIKSHLQRRQAEQYTQYVTAPEVIDFIQNLKTKVANG